MGRGIDLSKALAVGLVVASCFACAKRPAPRSAYEGEPLRAAIVESCGPELLDAREQPCVQIDVFGEGEGEAASEGDWLTLHYIVLLPEGDELDSSHESKPLKLRLGHSSDVIEGMHLGLDGIRVGERRRFVVPPALGYRGRKIAGVPPEANLTFLVELVERRDEL